MNKAQDKLFRTLTGIFQKEGTRDAARAAHQVVIRLTEANQELNEAVKSACRMIGVRPEPAAIRVYLTAQSSGGKKKER